VGLNLPLKIVYVVPYAPTRVRTRPFHLIRALAAEGHEVTVVTCCGRADEDSAREELAACGVRVVAERLSLPRSLWNCLSALPTPDPMQSRYSWKPRLARRLIEATRQLSPVDVVHVEHLRGARYGLAVLAAMESGRIPRAAVVWDSVDCISSLFRRAADQGQTPLVRAAARFELPRTARYEPRVAARFDRVLMTSEVDRGELLELARRHSVDLPVDCVQVVPNGVDLEYFQPSGDSREARTLVMTGKMSYHANATAAVRFVEDVMPAVWARLPDVRLWIVGQDPPADVVKLGEVRPAIVARNAGNTAARVAVTGTVADVRPFLRKAAVAVAPIQYGVGIQNKVLEALACATPVVATPQAVSALEARSGSELVVASNPSGLSAAIVTLLEDRALRDRLGQAGRSFVERHHDWRVVVNRLAGIYRDVAA
jgi:glycosyltransferase involved in cell wall biosynthesis